MIAPLWRWIEGLRCRPRLKIDVVGAHPLSSSLAVYVIDVDGRRIVLAAGSHTMCVLSAYRTPHSTDSEGQHAASV